MKHLQDLMLRTVVGGYDFVLHDEVLGNLRLDGNRLTRFEVASDQRRRGVGRRAMQIFLQTVSPDARIEVEIPAGDPVAQAFAHAVGFGVKALVYDRRAWPSDETVELFRPVGQAEIDLIVDAGMRAFPPRLPEQPIFYPVATLDYARLIAADWNVRDEASGFVGYVLRFRVRKEFLDRYPPREAGGKDLIEHWIPAEERSAFNTAIVGKIEIVERHPGL